MLVFVLIYLSLQKTILILKQFSVPGSPSNIKVSTLSDESVLVSWLPPTLKNGRILHYTVYWREAGRYGQFQNIIVYLIS